MSTYGLSLIAYEKQHYLLWRLKTWIYLWISLDDDVVRQCDVEGVKSKLSLIGRLDYWWGAGCRIRVLGGDGERGS